MKRKRYYIRLEFSDFDVCSTDAYGHGESGTAKGDSYGGGYGNGNGRGSGDGYGWSDGRGFGSGYGDTLGNSFRNEDSSFIIEEKEEEVTDCDDEEYEE